MNKIIIFISLLVITSCSQREFSKLEKQDMELIEKSCLQNEVVITGKLDHKNGGVTAQCLSDKTIIECGSLKIEFENEIYCAYGVGVAECGCVTMKESLFLNKEKVNLNLASIYVKDVIKKVQKIKSSKKELLIRKKFNNSLNN